MLLSQSVKLRWQENTIKAGRWYKAKDIRVEEVLIPVSGAGRVKIKGKWTGICDSDLYEYTKRPICVPVAKPHPVSYDAPIVMGHEFSGEIAKLEKVSPGLSQVIASL